jgi:glycosyltransferase involved in cell wall biosynthesis
MRIAQIAPLAESVPPSGYGGTERIVSYITEELVKQGHDVTLFASGDSKTDAELVACSERALRLDPNVKDPLPYNVLLLENVRQRADDFDIFHFHTDYEHFPLFRELRRPSLVTLHGRLDLPDLVPLYREFNDMPLVSISDHQRKPLPPVNWVATIYHGMPVDEIAFFEEPSRGYLAFLGRISPEKRPDRAIEIARRSGMKLKIAAKIDPVDRRYFEEQIKPLIDPSFVELIGEFSIEEKRKFLGDAAAVLFPIDWPEPFGLVMIEAMAAGTPVIAYRRGSVPEVVDDGVTGFVVDNEEEAIEAIGPAAKLDRLRVRQRFEERFSVERMVDDYLSIYESLIKGGLAPAPIVAVKTQISGQ